jgi:hypothetical protein
MVSNFRRQGHWQTDHVARGMWMRFSRPDGPTHRPRFLPGFLASPPISIASPPRQQLQRRKPALPLLAAICDRRLGRQKTQLGNAQIQFNEQTTSGLKKAINDFKAKKGDKLKGFILDLCNNPGGLI